MNFRSTSLSTSPIPDELEHQESGSLERDPLPHVVGRYFIALRLSAALAAGPVNPVALGALYRLGRSS